MLPHHAAGDETARLFIALALPPTARAALAAVRQVYPDPSALRWVRPEQMHLTLRFLGNTSVEHIPTVEAALRETAARTPAFALRLGLLGCFGGRRPRVLRARIDGDVDVLNRTVAALATALHRCGFPDERDRFSAHLTLARVPERAASPARRTLLAWLATAATPSPAPIPATALHLIRSRLGPGGPGYQSLAIIDCAARPPDC